MPQANATVVPCCQVASCGQPIRNPYTAGYYLVRNGPSDPHGRQIVVCSDCKPRFERGAPTPEQELSDGR